MLSSGSRKRVPCSSMRAYPRHTLRSAVSLRQLHTIHTHSIIGLMSHRAPFSLTAASLSHGLPTIVSGAPVVSAQQQWPEFQSLLSKFSSACGALMEASSFACGGPRRAIFMGSFLGRLFLLLHDSSRPTRRTAKARRLRPARGMAPWVSGSHRSVLHGATPPPPPPPPSPPPPPPPPLAVASACPGHTTLEAVPSKRGRSACRARDTRRTSRQRHRRSRLLCGLKI